jgi:glycosyltransferase involved in cell wall biosynthesis
MELPVLGKWEPNMPDLRNTVLVAIRQYGLPHEPWMRRQISGMSLLDFSIMCWKCHRTESNPKPAASIFTIDNDPAPFDGRKRWLYRLANLRSGNFYAALGQERRKVRELIDSLRPSSILCYDGTIALKLIDIAEEVKLPLIAYFHGDLGFFRNRWYRWSLKARSHRFAAVVVVSQQERAWMSRHGVPDDRLHVIPCGAPTGTFLPKDHGRSGAVRFVMASRLAEEKGCKESILAFAELASLRRDVSLYVYGDGPERASLGELVQARGLGQLVHFHGYVNEQALAAALPKCDVFIQHSLRREGSPVSIVEAMSCGLPVVATAIGGIVDQIVEGDTGFLVPENDILAMSRAMLQLAEDPMLRERLGRKARRRAVEFFDSANMNRRLQQLILDVNRDRVGLVRSQDDEGGSGRSLARHVTRPFR